MHKMGIFTIECIFIANKDVVNMISSSSNVVRFSLELYPVFGYHNHWSAIPVCRLLFARSKMIMVDRVYIG